MGGPLAAALSTWRVLALADDPAVLPRLVAAVRAGGAVPLTACDVDQLLGQLSGRFPGNPAASTFPLVVYAWRDKPIQLSRLLTRLPGAEVVSVAPELALGELAQLLMAPRCNHFFVDDAAGLQTLAITIRKLVSGDLFGIEKYLPDDAEVRLVRLRKYEERTAAVDAVEAFAEQASVRRSVRAAVAQVCDELLMNALYDAPVDECGAPLFAQVAAKARLAQPSPRSVSLRYAASDAGFAIAVRDRYGRLSKAAILRSIEKCLHSREQIDRKVYGAGLGIYLIANAATQLVINIAPGIVSEVVCTFGRRVERGPLRALSVFVHAQRPYGASQDPLQTQAR